MTCPVQVRLHLSFLPLILTAAFMMSYIVHRLKPQYITLKESLELVREAKRNAVPTATHAAHLKRHYESLLKPQEAAMQITEPTQETLKTIDVLPAEEKVKESTQEKTGTEDVSVMHGMTR